MNCWICGAHADSGEHRVKASDLKLLFPDVSQQKPIFTKDKDGNIIAVGSLKSNKLKWESRLCHACNTTRTQPHDRAWEKLSTYLQTVKPSAKRIKLSNVFPGSSKTSMVKVHLFFTKLFGCLIAEHAIPIPLEPFSDAILEGKPHPHLLLGFGILASQTKNKAFITPVQAMDLNNKTDKWTAFANFHYMIRKVFVDIVYATDRALMEDVKDVYHATDTGKILRLSRLRANQQVKRQRT